MIITDLNYGKPIPESFKKDAQELVDRCNKLFQLLVAKPIITSGLRTIEDHIRIYAEKGIMDQKLIPMLSKHLFGQACDFSDPKGELKAKCKLNDYELLKKCELWMESSEACHSWIHLQMIPPKSGSREFKP